MRHFLKEYPNRPLNSKAGQPIPWDIITPSIGVIELTDDDPLVAELEGCVSRDQHGVKRLSAEEHGNWQKKRQHLPDWVKRGTRWRNEMGGGIAQDTLNGRQGKPAAAAVAETPADPTEAPVAPAPATPTEPPKRGPRRTESAAPANVSESKSNPSTPSVSNS